MIHNDDTRRFVVLRSPIVNACPLSPRPRQIARATHFRNGRVRLCLGERYAGNVVGVKPFGLVVQLEGLGVTGVLATEDLPDGPYRLEEARQTLVGKGTSYVVGDPLAVEYQRKLYSLLY